MTNNLNRQKTLSVLFPTPKDYLFVSGLAGAAKDTAALTNDGPNLFSMAGTMGAAISMGLGMAMSAVERQIAVITGDGELLMGLGSLVTVASKKPKNLSIVCIDNSCHGETGNQPGHTSKDTDLVKIAIGAGISSVLEISTIDGLKQGASILKNRNGPHFFNIKVSMEPPIAYKRDLNPASCRIRFKENFKNFTSDLGAFQKFPANQK